MLHAWQLSGSWQWWVVVLLAHVHGCTFKVVVKVLLLSGGCMKLGVSLSHVLSDMVRIKPK